MPTSIFLTALAIIVLAGAGYALKLLTPLGAVTALVVGIVTLFIGGLGSIALLFAFFASSNILGFWRRELKQSLGYEKGGARDQWQVLANGGPAILGLIIGTVLDREQITHQIAATLFATGLASANADTWATEVGSAIGTDARSILTGKLIARGQSGGVTAAGTAAAAAGALLIGALYSLLNRGHDGWHTIAVITLAGFCGAIVDSILGAIFQAQFSDQSGRIVELALPGAKLVHGAAWFKNDAVNCLSGVAAVLIAALLLWK